MRLLLVAAFIAFPWTLRAELKLPAIIGDHMVLQQKQAMPIWGWDTPHTKVSVTLGGQTKTAEADADGRWTVKLDAMLASSTPQDIKIEGTTSRELHDVLIGEVWMCSGQSNMQFSLTGNWFGNGEIGDWNGDIEALGSDIPNLRLVSTAQVCTQELQSDFKGGWKPCTPETCKGFSAVGFFFGRHLHRILGVPVGLISNAWAGSSAEAWIRRDSVEKDPRFKRLMDETKLHEAQLQSEDLRAEHEVKVAKWKETVEAMKKAGLKPGQKYPSAPVAPDQWLRGPNRPGNIFAGVLHPTLGYGIKGVIWYQGEGNAERAWEYRQLFPFMIEQWRKEWQQGNFSFYWVQLANYLPRKQEPGDSAWAELREAQTLTTRLPNTAQAIIIDLGEGNHIHPNNKHDVAARLVRLALARDYGVKVPFQSPVFKSLEFVGSKAIVTFEMFGSTLRRADVDEAIGFAICGEDKVWHWAKGTVLNGGDKVAVQCDQVNRPIAVRYAWADNPMCNLSNKEGLPVTPFRTDDFKMITEPVKKAE